MRLSNSKISSLFTYIHLKAIAIVNLIKKNLHTKINISGLLQNLKKKETYSLIRILIVV